MVEWMMIDPLPLPDATCLLFCDKATHSTELE